jgi:DNA-binding transcriptional ArsR family regulator
MADGPDDADDALAPDDGDVPAAADGDALAPADGDALVPDDDGALDPASAFSILGNETRLTILHELGEAAGPLSFGELRAAVAPDDTGNFNYHLGKLVDHFVRKTDDGYELRYAGEQVVRAVRAGTMTRDPTLAPRTIDERCPYCGTPVEMSYDDERILVRCPDCDGVAAGEYASGTIMNYGFPPAGLAGRSREAVVDAAHVLYDSKVTPMMKGVCPECAARVETSFDVCPDHDVGGSGVCPACDTRFEVWASFECENCRYSRRSAAWFAAANHPRVVSFYHDHGLTEAIPFRKLTDDNAPYVRDVEVAVLATDPHRFEVTVPVDDEVLVVELDADLDVVESTRRPRDGRSET